MALITAERSGVATQYMRDSKCPGAVTKTDLTAAIAAADDWVDTNTASFNSALPTAFKTGASASQKIELLMYVLEKRMAKY